MSKQVPSRCQCHHSDAVNSATAWAFCSGRGKDSEDKSLCIGTRKEAQLNDFGLARIQLGEFSQSLIERDQVNTAFRNGCQIGLELDLNPAVAPLGLFFPGVVHEDLTHDSGC